MENQSRFQYFRRVRRASECLNPGSGSITISAYSISCSYTSTAKMRSGSVTDESFLVSSAFAASQDAEQLTLSYLTGISGLEGRIPFFVVKRINGLQPRVANGGSLRSAIEAHGLYFESEMRVVQHLALCVNGRSISSLL